MSTLKHLRSSTADKRPTASGLADGQLAINTASGTPALFFKDSASGVVKVGPAHVGSTAPNATPAGSAGNSLGELWINNGTTINGLNYYNGSSFVNLTPSGTTSAAGLVELATAAETQAGTDGIRAVTPSGLQSKVSDSIATTSSTTIASATAVKTAYDLANAALARTGGTVTGEIVISPSGAISFEGSSDDGFETTLAVVNPTADRTITFPNITGTVITNADTGTVTSTMIADGTIVNADINASASIALSKLATGALPSGITIASSNIVDGTIVNADINAAAAIADTKLATISSADKISLSALNIDGGSDIGADLADADLFIVDDGGSGTNRKAPSTRLRDYIFSKVSGHITTTPSGVATIASGVITSTMIVDETIVNADVNTSAAIAGTKISPNFGAQNVTTTGTSTAASFIPSSSTVPTNGVYLPAANSVGISTNGTGRLFVDASGDVGIGVSNPVNNLDIAGTQHVHIRGTTYVDFSDFWGSNDNRALFLPYGFLGSSGSNAVSLFSNGYRNASSGFTYMGIAGNTGTASGLDLLPTGNIIFRGGAASGTTLAERFRIDSTGFISLNGDTNTGFSNPSADNLAITTGGTERARIDSSGRLLLGTSTSIDTKNYLNNNYGGPSVQQHGVTQATSVVAVYNWGNSSAAPAAISLNKSLGNTVGVRGALTTPSQDIGSIVFSGDDGTVFIPAATILAELDGTPGANDMPGRLVFSTTADGASSPTERVRITSAGNVGIGTTSPGQPLTIAGANPQIGLPDGAGNTATIGVAQGGGGIGNLTITGIASKNITFNSPTSEFARIDSSGRLLLGTSSVQAFNYSSVPRFQVSGTSQSTSSISTFTTATSANVCANVLLGRARGTQASPAVVVSNDAVGVVQFEAHDGTNLIPAARIEAFVDGTPGANDMPGRLVFSVTADGSASPSEAMRINNAGELLVGYTSDNGAYKLQVNSQIFATSAIIATSDGRYKENVAALDGCVDLVKALRPVSFDWKAQEPVTRVDEDGETVVVREAHNFPDGKQVGFIAQEVEEVLADKPWLGSVIKQNVRPAVTDADGNELAPEEEFLGIAEGNLVAVLTSALKDAIGRIESLEAEVAALKA